jgi:hypothetical protein
VVGVAKAHSQDLVYKLPSLLDSTHSRELGQERRRALRRAALTEKVVGAPVRVDFLSMPGPNNGFVRPLDPFVRAQFGTYRDLSYSLSGRLGEIKDEEKHWLTAVE